MGVVKDSAWWVLLTHPCHQKKETNLTHSSLPPSLPPGNQRCWLMSSFCRAVSSQCISTNFTLAGENYRSGFPTKLNVLCAWDWISEPLLFFCLAESRQFLSFSAFQDSFVEQLRRWTRSFIASFALILVQIPDTRYPQIPTLGPTIPWDKCHEVTNYSTLHEPLILLLYILSLKILPSPLQTL